MTENIVIASTNSGKVYEIRKMLKPYSIKVKSLNDFVFIPPIKEDGITFEENAYKKASITAKILELPVIADDSGLIVESLNGKPGIYSARYAGEFATDLENSQKLLDDLEPYSNRNAYFKCVISLATPNGKSLTYTGTCNGLIGKSMVGKNGFGYDSLFFFEALNKTFAELSFEQKNLVSHRGKALKLMLNDFNKILNWIKLQISN